MPRFAAFHMYWVFTVCQSTPLEVSSILRVKATVQMVRGLLEQKQLGKKFSPN